MGTEITQVLQGRFRTIDVPTVFLKIDTEGDKTRCAGSLFQNFTTELRRHRSRVEDGLVFAVTSRCALVVRLEVGGGGIQTG